MGAVLMAWALGSGMEPLVRSSARRAAMVPATALCLAALFAATGLSGLRTERSLNWSGGLSSAVLLIAMSYLVSNILDQPQPDHVLFRDKLAAGDRMSMGTSLGLVLGAFVTWLSIKEKCNFLALTLSILGVSVAVTILLCNSFVPGSLFSVPALEGMSVYTAAAFIMLFLNVLLVLDGEHLELAKD
ncbi:hypothetical protein GCM10011415_25740 [Salipiger pallidus]|uniref:Uncharacterized protein n=2 Tax=Salipiger pallidus TaxID=1775170 RepID=A0A8J2ZKW5_9RHOB|nr:hypothetical protein GCM10011415_25740 [Salipiger pallidus]